MSRKGCKRVSNKIKSKEPSQTDFQISGGEQRLDFCGMEKNVNCFDGGKYICLGKFLNKSFGNRR